MSREMVSTEKKNTKSRDLILVVSQKVKNEVENHLT